MSPRRIKWRTYWNFMKIVKRLPTKAERTIIKSAAYMVESMFEALINPPEEPKTWAGLPVIVDPRLEPDEWHVLCAHDGYLCDEERLAAQKQADVDAIMGYPETHTIGGVPREEINVGVTQEEAEATLCGCGHGDYRTCPCEPKHPSKATGQFDHHESVEWPEDD